MNRGNREIHENREKGLERVECRIVKELLELREMIG